MKWNGIGRLAKGLVASAALGLGMTACGGGTIGYLWVLGENSTASSGYLVAAYKIDDFSGNLTRVPTSPFTSGGTNPVQIVVRSGGRYVYVVNKGDSSGTGGSIQAYSVGGDGILVPQESYISQGQTPVWASLDTAGNFLYVLDSVNRSASAGSPYFGLGDITVYSVAADTGRLTLVTNQQVKDPVTNINLNYFPVGLNPTMLQVTGGGCVFTLDSGDQTIFPYQAASGGQLNLTTSGPIVAGTTSATSLTLGGTAGSTVYLTDASSTAHPNGQILPFTLGSSACSLTSIVGGAVDNISPAQNPVWTLTEQRNKKFLYVANQSSTDANNPNSSISVFTIDTSTGKLQAAAAGAQNPLPTGSGPVCLVEDPTNQYVYSSNQDGTVTGFKIDQGTGLLRALSRGSTFKTLTHLTCMAVSGAVD